jgi:hypothetical protein
MSASERSWRGEKQITRQTPALAARHEQPRPRPRSPAGRRGAARRSRCRRRRCRCRRVAHTAPPARCPGRGSSGVVGGRLLAARALDLAPATGAWRGAARRAPTRRLRRLRGGAARPPARPTPSARRGPVCRARRWSRPSWITTTPSRRPAQPPMPPGRGDRPLEVNMLKITPSSARRCRGGATPALPPVSSVPHHPRRDRVASHPVPADRLPGPKPRRGTIPASPAGARR